MLSSLEVLIQDVVSFQESGVAEQKLAKRDINRRDFMASAAVGTAMAVATHTANASVWSLGATEHKNPPRIGISDAAYAKAWDRAASMVAKMTLAEKISQTCNTAPAIKRLGISSYQYWSEALHGYGLGPGPHGEVGGTSFPQPLSLAGAWNPKLNRRVYEAISDEARAWHNSHGTPLAFYSPQTLNLHRDPRWGRCEEAPGEDPCLASTLAVEVIRGMQGDHPNYLKTTACAKHFICNNTDSDRQRVSATVNPRNFWEYYTRAYKACAIHADVFTFMSAFNAVNGIPCSADRFLLTSLLRNRWGFRGYVTSDCDAVYNIFNPHHYAATLYQAAAMAIQAGCDLNCGGTMCGHLGQAVKKQMVSEADISRAVTRLFAVRVLLGEFDPPDQLPYSSLTLSVMQSPAHRQLALDAARQSIVLLKNKKHFLPLRRADFKTVAVIGPMAGQCQLGQYSGAPAPSVMVSPYMGISGVFGLIWPRRLIASAAGVKSEFSLEGGTNLSWTQSGAWAEYEKQDFTGKNRIAVRVANPGKSAQLQVYIDSLDEPPLTTLTVPHTGGVQAWRTVSASIKGVTGKHKVFFRLTGEPGNPIANMEWFQLQPNQTEVTFHQGCAVQGGKNKALFAEAVDAAGKADIVIMVCGVTPWVDGEGHDRSDTRLTGVQHELIQACFNANPKTMLVLSTNNTVAVNWEQENLPAIISAICAGQAQGTAIADVLFGDYNPGGKTCCTWYKSVDQLPPFHNYDLMKGRTCMYFEGDPLYPFGYGLSYTTFTITDMHVGSPVLSEKKSVKISCTVANTGSRAGAEVVQFYVTVPRSPVKRPIKELVGFQRVELNPGESRRVTFTLPYTAQALWYWHDSLRQFVLQPGKLKLMIGHSSSDIDLTGEVELQACTDAELGGPETLSTVAVPVKVS